MTAARVIRTIAALIAAAFAVGLAASPALASNTRVSISDFKWSKDPHVDLGESVTWDWIGPDTMHSVTGQAPNATQWDSDPDISMPQHGLGDSYKVTFDHPGTYLFVCKMHTSVRGTVTVSDVPGNPNSDPGPQDPLNFDLEAPTVDNYFFTKDGGDTTAAPVIGPKGKGIGFQFASSESGEASADYYRVIRRGKGRRAHNVRKFQGYDEWETHIGLNTVRWGADSPTFRPVAGKYIAYFRVEDQNHNSTSDIIVRFEIKAKKKKKKKRHR